MKLISNNDELRRCAHKKLDTAVAAAYGWTADLTDEQILENLLGLNLEHAAEEAKQASSKMWKKITRDKARGRVFVVTLSSNG